MAVAYVNPYYLMSALYLTVGLASLVLIILGNLHLIEPVRGVTWLRVHFVTVGAVTQALFGTLPALAARKFGVPEQPAGVSWRQWVLLNLGFAILLISMPGQRQFKLGALGAVIVILALLCLIRSIYAMWLRAPRPIAPGARFYLTAPIFFVVGILMALSMLLYWYAPGGYMGKFEAHVHANVWGFLALIAAGTLYDFFPVLNNKPLARPDWIGRTYWFMAIGGVGLVAGPWLDIRPLTLASLAIYVVGTVHHLTNLIRTLNLKSGPLKVRALHLLVAYTWMVVPVFFAPFILLRPDLVPVPAIEAAALKGLVYGWIMQVALGAMPVFLAYTLRTGKSPAIEPPEAPDAKWFSLVTLNVGVGMIWVSEAMGGLLGPLGSKLLMGGMILVAAAMAVSVWQIWRIIAAGGQVTTARAPQVAPGAGA